MDFALLLLLFLCPLAHGFINCSAGGYKLCSSTDIAYVMTGTNNLNVSNCVYENCPQIIITDSTGISFKNVTFRKGNYSGNSLGMGGAVLIKGSKCTFQQVLFDRVANVNQGSAMYVFNSSIILENCTFYGNRAMDQGGAVMLYRAQAFNCTQCKFISNRAPFGGAVSVLNDNFDSLPFAYFINCLFDGNQAISINGTANGGAISAFTYAKVYLSYTDIVNGYSDFKSAGIYLIARANVYVEYLYTANLTAISGHFINSVGSFGYNRLLIRNSVFDNIGGGVHGGVFRINLGATYARIENSKFYSSNSDGGSVVYGDSLDINVPIYFTNCSFYDDVSLGGGVLHGRYSCTFMVDRCNFYNAFGGEMGAAIVLHDAAAVSRITNSGFYNCKSVILGGAIVCEAGDLIIDNCRFDSCSSVNGGAVFVETGSGKQLTISNSVFSNNKGRIGGDVCVYWATRATISNTLFYNSSALTGGSVASFIPLLMSNNTFYNVSAIQFGGAVYVSQATASISDCRVFYSSAGSGGAIFLDAVTLTMQRVNFTGCSSKRSGGVLYLSQGTASMNVVLSSGSTSISGGFLYSQSQIVHMNSVVVNDSSVTARGGVIYSELSNIVIENSIFGLLDSFCGGAFYLTKETLLTASFLKVSETNAVFGTIFYIEISSTASCLACQFLNSISKSNGTLVHATKDSIANLAACNYQNDAVEVNTGCLFYLQSANINVDNFDLEYGSSATGTLVYAIEGSTGEFHGLSLKYITATETRGSIVIADGSSTLEFSNCEFIHPRAEILFLATSSSKITFAFSRMLFYSTPPIYLSAWSQQITLVLFQCETGSSVLLFDSSKVGAFKGDYVSLVKQNSSFYCSESIISNSVTKNAPISGTTESYVNLADCLINSNTVLGTLDPCVVESNVIGLGGAISSSGHVSLAGLTEISSNSADFGGAIYISDPGTLLVGSGTIIRNNSASTYGGAFYIDTTGQCTIESKNVTISNNSALRYPSSDFAVFQRGFFHFDPIENDTSIFEGGVLVLNYLSAQEMQKQNYTPFSLKLEGKAEELVFINYANGSTIELAMNVEIPPIEIGALDGFNRLARVDSQNLVIINVEETAKLSPLKGETIKSILDPINRTTTLFFLSIPNRLPGQYTLQFTGTRGDMAQHDNVGLPLLLYIEYRLCLPELEYYVESENSCIPAVNINRSVRIAVAFLCLILIVGCYFTLYGLYTYREERLIKANSYTFLSIPVIGCMLAFLSPIMDSFSCIISTFLENIGFCLIFTSLLIKLYRIRVIFYDVNMNDARRAARLKEKYLLAYLLFSLLFFTVFEILWGIFENPAPRPTFIPSLGIVIKDKCNVESFSSYGMASLKFIISVVVSYMAFINRNVPSEFNESKYIVYSCYNWVIFGTIMQLTLQYFITNPDVAFAVKSLSLIISHTGTTLHLATFKVLKCWYDFT